MKTPILTTKLHIPASPQRLVPRPRLLKKLESKLCCKLALICAPAGFGKSTLVSAWVQAAQPRQYVAWLSLDESDNELTRFLTYLVAALRTIEGDIGRGVQGALEASGEENVEAVLTILLNEIAELPSEAILVLDDYHVIEAPPVHQTLAFVLEHAPPQLHLVIATREDPPLPLARLRARGQLAELRGVDLRFTTTEAAEFLNQAMGLGLSDEDVAALESRTEGWITGLQLAAISLQGRKDATSFIKSFTGSHRFVLDYLIEEVLNQQTAEVQAFLLQTAILDRLTGPLCNALTGQNNGQTTLEMLEHANLFIVPLDEARHWYRYHHLFAELLRQRLHETRQERASILHQRASEWYEQNGFADASIEHALCSEDFMQAARLIEEQVDVVWQRGEHASLRRWLETLPVDVILSKPHLCIFHAWYMFVSGQQALADRTLRVAEQALGPPADDASRGARQEPGRLTGAGRRKIQGRTAAIRAFMDSYRGNVPGI
ncbi:MAG: LuxR family transcriptional regulator, partial [Anaerolineae bacterium]|nr:LuxR family transcriptional regulator [Anaerolineae bacterium]